MLGSRFFLKNQKGMSAGPDRSLIAPNKSRTDLSVSVEGLRLLPRFALESWVAFRGGATQPWRMATSHACVHHHLPKAAREESATGLTCETTGTIWVTG